MITKKDIIAMAKHVVHRDAGMRDTRLMHPTRDWIMGLIAALVLFVGAVFYAAFTFISHTQFTEQPGVVARSIDPYNQEKIQAILAQYNERAIRFATLRDVEPPSVPLDIDTPHATDDTTEPIENSVDAPLEFE